MEEIYKDILGYEGLYKVSNLGNVKSLRREIDNGKRIYISKERILKPGITNGYNVAILSKNGKIKGYGVHVLVAMAFLGHIPDGTNKMVPDHKNDIKTDNRLENLQLITFRQNIEKHFFNKSTTSQYTGVSWNKRANKWEGCIYIDGKNRHLGRFKTEYEAHYAYQSVLSTLKNN